MCKLKLAGITIKDFLQRDFFLNPYNCKHTRYVHLFTKKCTTADHFKVHEKKTIIYLLLFIKHL